MRAQLQEARWLLKSLEIRNETLIKVARCIVERQSAFLDQGDEPMRPMILQDIAEAVEMHESTISRVTSGKYMHTPRGVFELRYFFSSQVEGADGSGTSSTAIRAKIKKLIKDEDADSPLSDSRIAELLSGEGTRSRGARSPSTARRWASRLQRAPPRGLSPCKRAGSIVRIQIWKSHNEQETVMQLNVTGHHVEVTAVTAELCGEEARAHRQPLRPGDRRALRADRGEAETEGGSDAARAAAAPSTRMRPRRTCMPRSTC